MSKDDYEVGYGKPPKSGQFSKGTSGNPKGRPKANKSLIGAMETIMNQMIDVKINGEIKRMTVAEATAQNLRKDLLTGSSAERARALKSIKDIFPNFQMPDDTVLPREIEVAFVESDNYGGIFEPTDEEKLWMKEKLYARRQEQRTKRLLESQGQASLEEVNPLDI